jgi:hypothetical protein
MKPTLVHSRRILSRAAILTLCAVWFNAFAPKANADPEHPLMHRALYELKEVQTYLKTADNKFGGHKQKAQEAVDAAIGEMLKALEAVKDPYKGFKGNPDDYKKWNDHPAIRQAIHVLRDAKGELKNAAHNFDGHRDNALKLTEAAISELEMALKFVGAKP